jgi:NAD+ synthase (glutamine-hydrolysing)
MKIALAQMEVTAFRPDLNVARMIDMINDARGQDVDLIAFPELCISGYLIGDKFTDDSTIKEFESYSKVIADASEGITTAFGNVGSGSNYPNKDGRKRRANLIYVVRDGFLENNKENSITIKTLLPTYRIFDDQRYFFSMLDSYIEELGTERVNGRKFEELFNPVEIAGVQVGFEICEDLWCEDYRMGDMPINATEMLCKNGAEVIVNCSASPWTYGKNGARDRRVDSLYYNGPTKRPIFAYVNCVGAQNNGKNIVTFDGGTTVYNQKSNPVIVADSPYKEELIVFETEEINEKTPKVKRKTHFKVRQKYDAIIKGIRHVKDMIGMEEHPKFVIGMSGGKDSALVAALLVDAVGKDKVFAINLPTVYNSEETKDVARRIADNLEIDYNTSDIGRIYEQVYSDLDSLNFEATGRRGIDDLHKENIQAKVRGTDIISNYGAILGALMTNNGNKVEVALGYATLYGDVNGAIAPIADLTPTEIYEMIKFVNRHEEIIPEELIPDDLFNFGDGKIFPSAELSDNQTDPIKFGYHCALLEAFMDYNKKSPEDVMQWFLDGELADKLNVPETLIERWGMTDPQAFMDDLEWFWKTMQRNVFKRVQAPPIIITSKTAFGYDLRESILPPFETKKYKELKQQILDL